MESQDKILELVEKVAKWLFKKKDSFPNPRFYAGWDDEIKACPLTEMEYLDLAKQILFNNNLAIIKDIELPEIALEDGCDSTCHRIERDRLVNSGWKPVIPLKEME